ncbi:hypothetical protein RHGRI_011618 [Rhododendron griersonianum]|uniref:Pentatricopeptide repeat-containing protein n=1 Tax=Rhododendron griersonianum TaxID=479676 RepID=A0AAV6KMZ9_9ERIC|nr:hypothetical protein RHGRI_011618 [Rhododendron griersonianum]
MLDLEGLKPNRVTVFSGLQACGQSNDLLFGMDVHQFIIANDIEMDLPICNLLIALYAKCGSLDYARELLENVRRMKLLMVPLSLGTCFLDL